MIDFLSDLSTLLVCLSFQQPPMALMNEGRNWLREKIEALNLRCKSPWNPSPISFQHHIYCSIKVFYCHESRSVDRLNDAFDKRSKKLLHTI
jgi:hypothetical protein